MVSIGLIISCRQNTSVISKQEQQAQRLLQINLDEALNVIDSALRLSYAVDTPNVSQIRLLLLRQQVFSQRRQMDSVLSVGVQIRRLALLSGDSLSIAKSLLPVRGEVSMEDQQALEPWLPLAIRMFRAKNMKYELAVVEGLTGAIATRKGKFAESMQHLYRSRDLLEALDSIQPLYALYMNIGNNLSGLGDPRASVAFYQKAGVVARRMKDSVRIATSLMNEGAVLLDMNNLDSSRMLLNRALSSMPAVGGDYLKLQIGFNLAIILLQKGELKSAEESFRNVVELANAIGDPFAIGMAKRGLAGVLGKTGRVGSAISIMETFLRQQDSLGLGYYSIEHLQHLIALYKEDGRYPEALAASEKLKALSDSVLRADKQKAVQELVLKYDFDKQEKVKQELQEKLTQRNRTTILLTLVVLGLSAFGVALRQRNRYQQELNQSYLRLLNDYRAKRDAANAILPPPVIHQSFVGLDKEEDENETTVTVTPSPEDLKLQEQLLHYFNEEKPYLNADLRSEDLARKLGIPTRRITEVIRNVTGQSYADYVNRFRIAEATRIMDTLESRDLKLEAIAMKCGFSSRQYFRRVFEQVTGVNPSYYRQRSGDLDKAS